MEPSLGHNFDDVRVHTDTEAAASARSLDAEAYTAGNDVVFGAGRYAPGTEAGDRLIAHELVHTIQQGGGRTTGIQRSNGQGSGRTAQQASPQMRRAFVRHAIDFFEGAAEHYTRGGQLRRGGLRSTLDDWYRTVGEHLRIIRDHLGGDRALTRQIRVAYARAVGSLVRAAAQQNDTTTHAIYQQHHERIREWAWPEATEDPNANELLDTLPAAERRRLRVMMSEETVLITQPQVANLFGTQPAATTVPLPAGVTVRFSSSIRRELKRGLRNVAGRLIQRGMAVNRIVTVPLDLEPYGGEYSAYRFTFVEHPAASEGTHPTREVLVERLGSIGMEAMLPSTERAARAAMGRHGFTRGSGWRGRQGDREFQIVLEAVSMIPDTLRSEISGIAFRRVHGRDPSDPDVGGDYDYESHTITLYDPAFATVSNRTGVPGETFSREGPRMVAHEIGHALDRKILRQVWDRFEQARNELESEFEPYKTAAGNYQFPAELQPRFDELQAAIDQARQQMLAARAPSGLRWQLSQGEYAIVEGDPGADNIEFRQAAIQDGPDRISTYSDDAWEEYFAESFSLYMTDPDTLRRLRPHVHEYFVNNFPR